MKRLNLVLLIWCGTIVSAQDSDWKPIVGTSYARIRPTAGTIIESSSQTSISYGTHLQADESVLSVGNAASLIDSDDVIGNSQLIGHSDISSDYEGRILNGIVSTSVSFVDETIVRYCVKFNECEIRLSFGDRGESIVFVRIVVRR